MKPSFFDKIRAKRAARPEAKDPLEGHRIGRWNGEACTAQAGTVVITKADRPTWWSAEHEGKRWPCLRVDYKGHVFFLADHDGSASQKVFEEGGGPASRHYGLSNCDPATFLQGDTCKVPPVAE